MVKHAKKNAETRRSQGGSSSSRTGQAAKKKTSAAFTHGPSPRSNLTDTTATATTTHLRCKEALAKILPQQCGKGKPRSLYTTQQAGKGQKTPPLTTEDISTIVRVVRDTLPEPNRTSQGSRAPNNTLDTEGMNGLG